MPNLVENSFTMYIFIFYTCISVIGGIIIMMFIVTYSSSGKSSKINHSSGVGFILKLVLEIFNPVLFLPFLQLFI